MCSTFSSQRTNLWSADTVGRTTIWNPNVNDSFFGTWTVCFHVNSWSAQDVQRLKRDLGVYREKVLTIDEVLTADSAEAARAIFLRRGVDMVLADQRMPGTSGVQPGMEIVRGPSRVLKTLKDGTAVKRQVKKPGGNDNANGSS